MEEKVIALSSRLVLPLMEYLDKRPHGEVKWFIDEISKSPQLEVEDVVKLLEPTKEE